ncbi:fungal hydrophobin [Ganoderma leucocontextum]|nr:fungal hydrophobin [Ganoderma leucocontextum]
MFARLAAVSTLAFAVLAAAWGEGECNTGPMQCCDSIEDSHSAAGSKILAALGVNVQDVTGQIGMGCSPITAVGVSGTQACSAAPVCCENNNVGGGVSLGCAPVKL